MYKLKVKKGKVTMIKVLKEERDKYYYEALNMFIMIKNNLAIKTKIKNVCLCNWDLECLPLFIKNNDITEIKYCNEHHKIKYFYIYLYLHSILKESNYD